MNNLTKVLRSLVVALVLAANSGGVFAAVAGHVQFVYGTAQLTTAAGTAHPVQKGDAVNEGDTLTTAPAASVQVRMEDGGFIAVRPDTTLKFDSFKFNGQEDGTEQSFFSLLKGGFRAVTGLIGRLNKANYGITTPSGSIGIRGTDHETFVVAPGSPLAANAPVGTYNKVNLGETSLTTRKGTIFILPNQMGFAGAADQMPELQPLNLHIFTATPAPQGQGGRNEGEMRDNVVVDGLIQEQALALGSMVPASPSLILTPIFVTYQPTGVFTNPPPPVTRQIAP
jgi:hypothetical protein